jgi:hypothetical protein
VFDDVSAVASAPAMAFSDGTVTPANRYGSLRDSPGHGSAHAVTTSAVTPCSPTWFGDSAPEIDQRTGGFTGRVVTTLNDAVLKDPCVRRCVQEHEDVHVRRLVPLLKQVHDCDAVATTEAEKGRCNQLSNQLLPKERAAGECAAYVRSFTCLTLSLLDPQSPCSKSPHKEEIQKHRGYEACEMRNYCHEAGTPELGFPAV